MLKGRGRFYLKFPFLEASPLILHRWLFEIIIIIPSSTANIGHSSSPPHTHTHNVSTFGFLSFFPISHSIRSFHRLDLSLAPFQQAHSVVECGGPRWVSMLRRWSLTCLDTAWGNGFWRQTALSFNPTPSMYNDEPFIYALTTPPHLSVALFIKGKGANNIYYVG